MKAIYTQKQQETKNQHTQREIAASESEEKASGAKVLRKRFLCRSVCFKPRVITY